mmetsp:Transcript_3742/g.8543  ORF Transcript_3742/g.8543 Transcript_3742/m.8543 type:complete len:244 (+) Transcript_3742:95-826(+)
MPSATAPSLYNVTKPRPSARTYACLFVASVWLSVRLSVCLHMSVSRIDANACCLCCAGQVSSQFNQQACRERKKAPAREGESVGDTMDGLHMCCIHTHPHPHTYLHTCMQCTHGRRASTMDALHLPRPAGRMHTYIHSHSLSLSWSVVWLASGPTLSLSLSLISLCVVFLMRPVHFSTLIAIHDIHSVCLPHAPRRQTRLYDIHTYVRTGIYPLVRESIAICLGFVAGWLAGWLFAGCLLAGN